MSWIAHLSDKEDWFQNISDWSNGLFDSPFDLEGNYKHMLEPLDIQLHDLLMVNERYLHDGPPRDPTPR